MSVALFVASLLGCGANAAAVGSSHAPHAPGAVELSLALADGTAVELAHQRGGIVLLFVVSTYDGVCQAAIAPVSSFTLRHLDTVVVAIIAQPDAETFASLYDETFSPPFTVTYEPEETITLGTSDLGVLDAVPTFVMLDAYGVVADTHVGWLTDERLEAMYRRAVEHGGIEAEAGAGGDLAPAEPAAPRDGAAESSSAAPTSVSP